MIKGINRAIQQTNLRGYVKQILQRGMNDILEDAMATEEEMRQRNDTTFDDEMPTGKALTTQVFQYPLYVFKVIYHDPKKNTDRHFYRCSFDIQQDVRNLFLYDDELTLKIHGGISTGRRKKLDTKAFSIEILHKLYTYDGISELFTQLEDNEPATFWMEDNNVINISSDCLAMMYPYQYSNTHYKVSELLEPRKQQRTAVADELWEDTVRMLWYTLSNNFKGNTGKYRITYQQVFGWLTMMRDDLYNRGYVNCLRFGMKDAFEILEKYPNIDRKKSSYNNRLCEVIVITDIDTTKVKMREDGVNQEVLARIQQHSLQIQQQQINRHYGQQ